jgi:hypothetical protein
MRPFASIALFVVTAVGCGSFGADTPAAVDAAVADGGGAEGGGTSESAYAKLILSHRPRAYWRMGERSGTRIKDETGRGNDLVVEGTPTLGIPGAIAAEPDTAISFEARATARAINARDLDFAGSGTAGPVEYSLEAWVRPAATDDGCPNDCYYQYLVCNVENNAAGYGIYFQLDKVNPQNPSTNNTGFFHQLTKADGLLVVGAAPGLATWSHIVAVREATRLVLYVNNTQRVGPTTNLTLPPRASDFRLSKLCDFDSYWFLGGIDEMAVYDHALTSREVAEHYDQGRRR